MAREIHLTDGPVAVVSPLRQFLTNAIDVSGFDRADLLLGVLNVEGTSPSVSVRIITGMQKDSDTGWVELGAFAAVTVPNTWEKKEFAGLLRYIRWEVTAVSGTPTPGATFVVTGMVRNN